MAKIDRQFEYLGLENLTEYDCTNKKRNTLNYVAYMLNRSNIMFRYHNLPETIPAKELERLLQTNGFAVYGMIEGVPYAVNAGLGGQGDVYNRPTIATVAVPYLNYNANWEIDKDCVVIPNDTNMFGLLPLYVRYCSQMVESDTSIVIASINKRIQSIISANDNNTFESAKKYLEDVKTGKLGVILESKFAESLKVSPISTGNTTSLTDLIELHQYIKASMYNDIGLGANWNAKRERLTQGEVELNTDNLYPLVDDMLENRRVAIEQINNMFGTNIEVELNSSWDYRMYNGESIHNTESEIDISEIPDTTGDDEPEQDEPETTGDDEPEQDEPETTGDDEPEQDEPETTGDDEPEQEKEDN